MAFGILHAALTKSRVRCHDDGERLDLLRSSSVGDVRRPGGDVLVRRAVTMLPALVVLALELPVTQSLVVSQVALSFGIPFALLPLVSLTSRRAVKASS